MKLAQKKKGVKNLRSKPGELKTSDELLRNVESVADGEELWMKQGLKVHEVRMAENTDLQTTGLGS